MVERPVFPHDDDDVLDGGTGVTVVRLGAFHQGPKRSLHVYPLSIVPAGWKWLYSLNPMVGVIEGFRWAVLGKGDLNGVAIGLSLLIIAVMLIGGVIFFKWMERFFADVI